VRADLNKGHYYDGMYPLGPAETMAYFGTTQPTRADFDRVDYDDLMVSAPSRGMGRCVVLYEGGEKSKVAFWGSSGY
jgi:hypothetical protein